MYYNQLQRTNEANEVLNRLIPSLEQQYTLNPSNPTTAFGLASAYIQGRQYNRALELLDALVANPKADTMTLLTAANAFAQLGQVQKLEFTLAKLVQLVPDNPEAWYDLAAVQATLGKNEEAIQSLRRAFPLSTIRLAQQPNAKDLVSTAASDQRFNALRLSPEFQKLIAPK
jgi:tetratricopeptide (TPR) repeat protein